MIDQLLRKHNVPDDCHEAARCLVDRVRKLCAAHPEQRDEVLVEVSGLGSPASLEELRRQTGVELRKRTPAFFHDLEALLVATAYAAANGVEPIGDLYH